MTPEHAQEPWARGERLLDIVSAKGNLVARLAGTAGKCEVEDANLRRIVACVNALEPLETEFLEEVGANLGETYAEEFRRGIELVKQRDELLAALQVAEGFVSEVSEKTGFGQVHTLKVIKAAINKTTGETK